MKANWNRRAGALMLFGFAQFLMVMIISEALYPGYSPSNNWISDLGVGSTAALFNPSIILLGILVVIAAYMLFRGGNGKTYPILQAITGIGAMGVGLLPETTGTPHIISAFLAFGIGGIAAIYSYRLQGSPIKYYSVALGIVALLALIIGSGLGLTLGLGKGGMERMILYPIMIWGLAFAGYLLASK